MGIGEPKQEKRERFIFVPSARVDCVFTPQGQTNRFNTQGGKDATLLLANQLKARGYSGKAGRLVFEVPVECP